MDIANIQKYNALVNSGVDGQSAFYRTMMSSSIAAKDLTASFNGNAVSQEAFNITTRATIGSLIAQKAATIALQVATMALNAAISMGISFAISGLVSLITDWANAEKEAREAALETGEAAKQEASNLMDLYNAYSKANTAYHNNTGSKESLNSATEELLKALGVEEAEIQRLIQKYGNLDSAINNLTTKALEEKLSELTSGYNASVKTLLDKTKDGWFTSFSSLDFSIRDKDSGWFSTDPDYRFVDKLKEAGYIDSSSYGSAGGSVYLGEELGDNETLEGVIKIYQKLIDMREILNDGVAAGEYTREELANDDLYISIQEKIDSIEGEYDDVLDYINQINKAATQLQYMDYIEVNGIPETIDEFNTLKQTLLDTAESSGQYVGSNEQINDSIINSLSEIPELSEFFSDYSSNADKVVDKAQAVKAAFSKAAYQNTDSTSNMYQDLVEWYDSLSDDNKELVYKITLDTNTAQWNLDNWKQALDDAQFHFSDLMAEEDTDESEGFKTQINNYIDSVNALKSALTSLNDGSLDETDLIELFEKYPELANNTDNLSQAIVDQIKSLTGYKSVVDSTGNTVSEATGIMAVFEDAFGKVDSEEDTAALQAFMDTVLELGKVVGNTEFAIDIEAETTGMEKLWTAMKESVSSTGLTAESIKELKARYQELENYDAARLFEKTTNGIHLNTKALRELESEYEKQKKIEIDNSLDTLIEQYNDLTDKINNASDAANTAELYAQRNDILDQINDTSELAAMYEGLTSAFYKWEQAQSIGEEGDMYDSLAGSLENIKELYDEGLIGTNKFRTAVQLMSNEDLSTASIDKLLAAYDEGYDKMIRYFQDSSDGCINFLQDIQELNSEWAHMNEDGSWDINFGVGNDQEIADALGINVESIQAIMRKLSDYGFDINLDSIFTKLDNVKSSAEEANEKLIKIGATDITFNFGTDDFDYLDQQIQQATDLLNSLYNNNGELNVKYNEEDVENAIAIIERLIYRKQSLDDAAILKVDTSNATTDIETIIQKLQGFKEQYNNLTVQTAIGADTTKATSACDGLMQEISNMDAKILATLGIDTTSLDKLNTSINKITPELMVKAGLDASLIEDYQAEKHKAEGTVIWDNNIDKVTSWIDKSHIAKATVNWENNTQNVKKYFSATGIINWVNSGIKSKAQGTAFAHGNWGTKENGVALGGEIGQELVVRNGKFFTIGEDSAEFFAYKKGDIIFNAEQTRQILANGKITNGKKRGVSYAEGTAFSSGSGRIVVSGNVKTTPSGGNSSDSSSSNTPNSDNSNDSSKDEPETIDWIEIAINRIEQAIDKLKTTATNTYKTLKTKLGATYDEISKVNQELSIQQQAYNRYIQQANSVGLSSDIAQKVRDGTIDINEYDNDTAELIKEYQNWYEKALDCSDAIQQLHENLASLYEDKFNNIQEDFENQLDLIEHLTKSYETGINELKTRNYLESTKYYVALQDAEKQNITIMEKELASLTQHLSEAMASGEIEQYSEAWYSMRTAINDVKEAIAESNVQLIEYANTMREIEWSYFDFIQDRIAQITQESDFLIDLMSNKNLYQDSGQFSDEGLATMGLHTQNYNVYMAQADQYADELLAINKELANDPYNTKLIERREELLKLQQDSILAAEDEKQAIVDMVEEGIKIELENLKELIDTYKDGLDSAKDLYNYQKKVEEKSKDIAALQKQLSAYENDTSEETKAKIQQIKVDLADAQEDLAETEYQQFISDTKSLLDNLYTEYETILNERLDNVDALLSDMIDMVNTNAINISDTLNGNTNSIRETLERVSNDVGYTMSTEMRNIWNTNGALSNVVTMYGDNFLGKLTTINAVLSAVQANTAAMAAASNQIAQNTVRTTYSTPPSINSGGSVSKPSTPTVSTPSPAPAKSISVGKKINAGSAPIYDYAGDTSGEHQYYSDDPIYTVLKEQNGYLQVRWHKLSSGITGWFKKSDVKAYKTGGLVNYTGLAQLDGTPGKPELVLNAKDTKNFIELKDVLRTMSAQELSLGQSSYGLSTTHLSGLTDVSDILTNIRKGVVNNESSVGDVNIDIMIDHVDDYNDFITKLQKDKQFESMIRSMTTDQLAGGSTLAKNKYRWTTQK